MPLHSPLFRQRLRIPNAQPPVPIATTNAFDPTLMHRDTLFCSTLTHRVQKKASWGSLPERFQCPEASNSSSRAC